MANLTKRLESNVAGDFYVDSTCIDCGACRWIAPETFNSHGDYSRVHAQPKGSKAVTDALRALTACPTASIGTVSKHDVKPVIAGFPEVVAENVYFCGFTSEHSFGAAAWLIVRPQGNVLIDSPRFVTSLVKRMHELGGVKTMFLTHKDDVADHEKFAAEFGCTRVMHAEDIGPRTAMVEQKIHGRDAVVLDDELTVIPTPGHTDGSACLLYRDTFLFTGDHLAWSPRIGHLYAFKDACWGDWNDQIAAMERLSAYRFRYVLPGHGWPLLATHDECAAQMVKCVAWMREQTPSRE